MPVAKNAFEQQIALMNPGNRYGLTPDSTRDANFNLLSSPPPVETDPTTPPIVAPVIDNKDRIKKVAIIGVAVLVVLWLIF